MGRKHAKIISQDAFQKAFIEGEMIMRQNLSARIQGLIDTETNEDIKSGLSQAQEIVYGKVEVNDVG